MRYLFPSRRRVRLSLALLFTALCLLGVFHPSVEAQETKENAEFKLAVNLFNDGMNDLALQQFKNFIDIYPNGTQVVEARFYLGLTQMKLNRFEDARLTFQNFALSFIDHPKAPEAWMKTAEAFAGLENYHEAALAYERVRTFYPKSPLVAEALYSAASYFLRAGERESAKKTLRTILQEHASHQRAHAARLAMARLYADEGQPSRAEQEARLVSEGNAPATMQAEALTFLGSLRFSAGLFTDAEKTFRSVVTSYPGSAAAGEASLALGEILLMNGNYPDALQQFTSALSVLKEESVKTSALWKMAETYRRQKNYSEERAALEKIIASSAPGSDWQAKALYAAGVAAHAQQKRGDAARLLSELLTLPEHPLQRNALLRLAEVASADRAYADAASHYMKYLRRHAPDDPASADVQFLLARLYDEATHDWHRAIAVYEELLRHYPQSAPADDAAFRIGACYEALEKPEEARSAYVRLLENYPASSYAGRAEERTRFLDHHKIKDRDGALDRLTHVMGEMLSEKPRAAVALGLGDIYFNDLKDYTAAIQYYTSALDNGALADNQYSHGYFNRARAYHHLSEIDSLAAGQAVIYYDAFVKHYPTDSLNGSAGFYSFLLKSRRNSSGELLETGAGLVERQLPPNLREELLAMLARHSLQAPTLAAGLAYTDRLAREFPHSSRAQRALMNAGIWFVGEQKIDSALAFFTRALEQAPAGRYAAAILYRMAQIQPHADAARNLKKLLTNFAYTDEAQRAERDLPQTLLAAGMYDDVIERVEQWQSQHAASPFDAPDSTDNLLYLARAYEKKGNAPKATEHYQRYLLHHPGSGNAQEVYYALGVLARAGGHAQAAAVYFKQAAALGKSGTASPEIVDLLFLNEQYDAAAEHYTQLAFSSGRAPDEREHFSARAIVSLLRQEKLTDAEPRIEAFRIQFGEKREAEAEFAYETGLSWFRQQNYDLAKKSFERVTGKYAGTRMEPSGQFYLAKILEVIGSLEEAATQYQALLERFPNADITPRVLLSLGNMHYNAERYEESIHLYQIITAQPEAAGSVLPFAMNNLIEAYESTKLYDAALKVTRDFIERFPNDESIFDKEVKVGTLSTRLGYYDQAVLQFQGLLDRSSSAVEAELRYNIGEAYYYKGEYQQAILEFLKVPYLVSKQGKVNWTATSLYMAGQAYEKMSRIEEALGMYQQIIDRPGIDVNFKNAARKEIDRVKSTRKGSK